MVSFLGKLFFIKTIGDNRLGYLHGSIGSLAFAHLGLKSKVDFSFENKTVFTINRSVDPESFFNRISKQNRKGKLIIFDTHYYTNMISYSNIFKEIKGMPVTSLYESDGHGISLEGRIRKHTKVIKAPKAVRSIEGILSIYSRTHGKFN